MNKQELKHKRKKKGTRIESKNAREVFIGIQTQRERPKNGTRFLAATFPPITTHEKWAGVITRLQ